jgi:GTP cyclohydrolase I
MPVKKVLAKKVVSKTSAKKVSPKEEGGVPLSVVIRRRIEAQKARFHANDNIAAFIKDGELEGLVDEVAQKMQAVLESLVIDTVNDHNTQNTCRRVAKMYVQEVFNGRYVEQPALTKFPNVSRLNELMIIGPITVRSACSHHLCPIMGRIWIGVLPSKDSALIGLSKYSRLTEWVMCRPQIQEEAVVELADMLEKKIKPEGVAVVMDADHFCMQWRGVKDRDSKMINSVMRGAFLKNSNLRREFLSLINRK